MATPTAVAIRVRHASDVDEGVNDDEAIPPFVVDVSVTGGPSRDAVLASTVWSTCRRALFLSETPMASTHCPLSPAAIEYRYGSTMRTMPRGYVSP